MMQNKNILFLVISMNKGGAERVVSILLDRFSKRKDINISLIMLEDGISYELPSCIQPIILFKKNKSSVRKFIELPFVAYKISKFVKKNNIDTIVSFLYRPNYINILTKFFGFKGRCIINIRSTTSRYKNEGLLGEINLFLIKKLFNKADFIISNSIGVKSDLDMLLSTTTQHISIPNPIDFRKINELKNKKESIDLDKNIDYIISVGRLIPLKRNKDLIKAFFNVHTKLLNTKLLFVGDGFLQEKLLEYAKDLKIENKVVLIGNVDNPFYYLNLSKLFVMTSEIEGFPNVLVEAMACGLPVISSNCKSGPSEILQEGKYGILYEVGDIDTLSKKILMVLQNKNLQEKLSNLSLERVKSYDIDKISKKFEKAILK